LTSLNALTKSYSDENLISALRSLARNFRPLSKELKLETDESITQSLLIGEIDFSSEGLAISSHLVFGDLTERSSRKKQFDLAKNFLKSSLNQNYQAGIFIFHDSHGNFRMSLVYAETDGKKRLWSNFRRFTYFVSPYLPNRTFIKQFGSLSFSTLDEIKDAFSITAVTNLFYEEFFQVFDGIVETSKIPGKRISNLLAKDFATLFVIRIIFLGFIQKKSWIGNDQDFLASLWKEYSRIKEKNDNFYRDWLTPFFFRALNSPYGTELPKSLTKISPEYRQKYAEAPFLNGGLFRIREGIDDQEIEISDEQVEKFFNFLFSHTFTIEENSNQDEDLQLNPEFLGIIFERLVNGENGAVYTPRPEVDFMCRMALSKWIQRNFEAIDFQLINSLIFRSKEVDFRDASVLSIPDRKKLLKAVEGLTICDPAVGSGAFLVGMLQVIEEFTDIIALSLGQKEELRFDKKRKIVRDNLYGVEVKEWAVWICQLRLWLTIFIEAPNELIKSQKAILPSLDFKIRQGDSLVQLVGKVNFPIAEHSTELNNEARKKLEDLRIAKSKYFENIDGIDAESLKKKELAIYVEMIKNQLDRIKEELPKLELEKTYASSSLFGELDSSDPNISRLEKLIAHKLAQSDELIGQLKVLGDEKPLVWGIEFSEIFNTDSGFDVIIGNPPYIRQEDIEDPLGRIKDKKVYKSYLEQMVKEDYPDYFSTKTKINAQSDLYTYFYIRSLRLLNSKGVHIFICSNSWLDVDYGHWMQKFLLERCTLDSIYDSQAIRSFSGADVNTVISVIFPQKRVSDYVVKFVDLKSNFGDFSYSENINDIQKSHKTVATDSYRAFCISRSELIIYGSKSSLEETTTTGDKVFMGDKWGAKYLRSPDIYHKLVLQNPTQFLSVGNLAEVKFGAKTGINEFFILDDATIKQWGIEKKYLKPLLRSVKEVNTYFVEKNELRGSLFFCNYSKKELKGTNALKYIQWGEKQQTKNAVLWPNVESVQGRDNWYSIGAEILKNADILSNRFIDSRFFFIEAGDFSVADTFFIVKFTNSADRELLIALMNSSLVYLFTEIYGRKNLGEGLLTIYGPELKQIPVPDPKQFTAKARIGILNSYSKLRGNVIQDIFSELGFDPLNGTVSSHKDRHEFDLKIMRALGYEESELSEVYNSLVDLVRQRKSKSQSF
jgi:hypothetical protein